MAGPGDSGGQQPEPPPAEPPTQSIPSYAPPPAGPPTAAHTGPPTGGGGLPPPGGYGGPPPGGYGAPPPAGGGTGGGLPWVPLAVGAVVLAAVVAVVLLLTGGDDTVVAGGDTTTSSSTSSSSTTTPTTPTTPTVRDGEPFSYGDDAELDALFDACADADFQSCDDLFFASPSGSAYRAYGDSCGGRNRPAGLCVDIHGGVSGGGSGGGGGSGAGGGSGTTAPPQVPDIPLGDPALGQLGDDPFLDDLWIACEAGDPVACDELFFASPSGSAYEAYGDSCGYRNEPAGLCEVIYG